MCGISGIFEFNSRAVIPREVVHRMNETLRHRGPDDGGIYVGPGIGLGHRRLSIIDVAGGHQPMFNEDETVCVLFNGEIYNYLELRQQLLARGHTLTTQSDTEAVAHLYEDFGENCFEQLNGMFAIAIWDVTRRRLVLGRDRIGEKPLYYSVEKDRVIFGSELKALLAADSLSREPDAEALSDYFSLGYVPAPKTIYRSVRKVRPGHYVVASDTGLQERQYWDLSFDKVEERPEAEWCDYLKHRLCEVTRARLMSEVPLGAFLSGGVDSSSVVAMMSHIMKRPVTTCSIGFQDEEYNEAGFARQVAGQFHSDHHEEIVQPDAVAIMDKLVWHYDEPFADSSAVPTYYVSQIARRHVTVALGGDGGDENFAGYRRYYYAQLENRRRSFVPPALRKTVFGPLGRAYPPLLGAPRILRGKSTLQSLSRTPLEGYFNYISIFRPDDKTQLLSPDFQSALGQYDSMDVFRQYYDHAGTEDLLSKLQYVDMKTYLPDDILVKVDRASMAVSLEVRAPFLDDEFMEQVAAMPSSLKLRGKEGKFILKRAMKPVLSNEILYRSKQGFAVPLKRWFRQ
ncbi:MAG TPA: asparagine synthase (glutamine-hydrolyzing), partial [Alphaproteobacteria bacterium]|nr:asparagine synthase (glutamine-hydrolyzing) [Alphaproteobacteria bacterium]